VSARRLLLAAILGLGGLGACANLLGLEAVEYVGPEAGADAIAGDGAPPDGAPGDGGARDGDAAGCVADLASDPRNCGACGHDCLAGDCADGGCRPFVVATGLSSPHALALGPDHVYWAVVSGMDHDVVRCPRSGCGAKAPELVTTHSDEVESIVATRERLYFTTGDTALLRRFVLSCALDACGRTSVTLDRQGFSPFTPLDVRDDGLYWGKQDTTRGEIRRVPWDAALPGPDGGMDAGFDAEALVTTVGRTTCAPTRLATSDAGAWWACFAVGVEHCAWPCAEEAGVSVSDAGPVLQLARGSSYIVFGLSSARHVLRDGQTESKSRPTRDPSFVLVGDTMIYVDPNEPLRACAMPDCTASRDIAGMGLSPLDLAADDRAVYWITDQLVMGVAR
jgi:hypothetical protein